MANRTDLNLPIARQSSAIEANYRLVQLTRTRTANGNIAGAATWSTLPSFTPKSAQNYLRFSAAWGARMYSAPWWTRMAIYKDGSQVDIIWGIQSGSGTDNGAGGGFIMWVTTGVTAVAQVWHLAGYPGGAGCQINGDGAPPVYTDFVCEEYAVL